MLVTGYEVYCKNRFAELESEGKIPNHDALLAKFAGKDERQNILTSSQATSKSITQCLIDAHFITFQNWESCKIAYNKGYGIKFGELGLPDQLLADIQKYIEWRHKIIHSKKDMTILNNEEQHEKWIYANKEFIIKARSNFMTFIERIHDATLSIK